MKPKSIKVLHTDSCQVPTASFLDLLAQHSLLVLFELALLVNMSAERKPHGTLRLVIASHVAKLAAVAKAKIASVVDGRITFEDVVRTETAMGGLRSKLARVLARRAQSASLVEWVVTTGTEMIAGLRSATIRKEPRIGGATLIMRARREKRLAGMD